MGDSAPVHTDGALLAGFHLDDFEFLLLELRIVQPHLVRAFQQRDGRNGGLTLLLPIHPDIGPGDGHHPELALAENDALVRGSP